MGTQTLAETEFNALAFEKRLTSLKDSQESINNCCQWCLQNRQHHKKIVNAWLNVLKRVKVEQRLILFYLANDVVQYSKRRNYEYVESWGTALQKATTMVRDEKVKHKILRIFKIWEQRNVYNEEFISDLCGLISVVPSGPKGDEPHEFQPNYVINKIKHCTKLEKDTDMKLKVLKDHNPKMQVDSEMFTSLKDRAHVDDVEKEVEVYVKHMEDYINALKAEIKNRITLISVLKQAETQLEADRKDVKLVTHAYKMFGSRVKTFQKKLEEHMSTLASPVPSPDINAPSPSPDSDIDLPEVDAQIEEVKSKDKVPLTTESASVPDYLSTVQFTNAGYYNPVPPPSTPTTDANSFITNGFSSFIGSNMPFNLQNLNSSLFSKNEPTLTSTPARTPNQKPSLRHPPLPVEPPTPVAQPTNFSYTSPHLPLLPPPMPPFNAKTEANYANESFNSSITNTSTTQFDSTFNSTVTYQDPPYEPDRTFNTTLFNSTTDTTFNQTADPFTVDSFEPPLGANPYPPVEDYNPEQELDTWEPDASWMQPTLETTDTPESPPLFEKEGYGDPIEYHDNALSGAQDIDQRVLPVLEDIEDSLSSLGGKDVDHRNLISLTGSPADTLPNIPSDIWSTSDQDYRNAMNPPPPIMDKDYRLPPFNIENLKLPPPPPPPPKPVVQVITPTEQVPVVEVAPQEPEKPVEPEVPPPVPTPVPAPVPPPVREQIPLQPVLPPPETPTKQTNVENIDMDLSEDENERGNVVTPAPEEVQELQTDDNLDEVLESAISDNLPEPETLQQVLSMEPPPPLPDLPDDIDANNFLDDLSNDLNDFTNLSDELSNHNRIEPPMMWLPPAPPPPRPPLTGSQLTGPPLTGPPLMDLGPQLDLPRMPHMDLGPPMPMDLKNFPSMSNLPPPPPMMEMPMNPNNWDMFEEENGNNWLPEREFDNQNWRQEPPQNDWMPEIQNNQNFGFRGRGNNRGNSNFNNNYRGPNLNMNSGRGRGRGNFRGGNNYRGRSPRGPRGGQRHRGNFRGNFRGGY